MDWLALKERGVFLLLNAHPAGSLPRALFTILLTISRGGACWWAILGAMFLLGGRRGRRVAVTAALALGLADLAAWGLQGLVQGALPIVQYGGGVITLPRFQPLFSFPDARAALACAVVPFLTHRRGAARWVFGIGALLISDAGIYAGWHLPSDALGGMLVGLVAACAAVWVLGNPFIRQPGPLLPLSRGTTGRTALTAAGLGRSRPVRDGALPRTGRRASPSAGRWTPARGDTGPPRHRPAPRAPESD